MRREKRVKKSKKGEVNHCQDSPEGQSSENLEEKHKMIEAEMLKKGPWLPAGGADGHNMIHFIMLLTAALLGLPHLAKIHQMLSGYDARLINSVMQNCRCVKIFLCLSFVLICCCFFSRILALLMLMAYFGGVEFIIFSSHFLKE